MCHKRYGSMSTNRSSTSLNSLFSRVDFNSIATTPEIASNFDLPPHAELASLIEKKIKAKTAVLLVGLPASGKSTVCKQMAGFLNSHGLKSLVYNAGNIRRAMVKEFSDSEFFNPQNAQAARQREIFAEMCMENMLDDLKSNRINVGFLDATNTTRKRRHLMVQLLHESGIELSNIFILDVSCTDEKLVNFNITKKAFNADYQGCNVASSIADFKKRAEHYFHVYEPVLEEELDEYKDVSYISIQNAGVSSKFMLSKDSPLDDTADAMNIFVSSYYKLYGETYYAAVNTFCELAKRCQG